MVANVSLGSQILVSQASCPGRVARNYAGITNFGSGQSASQEKMPEYRQLSPEAVNAVKAQFQAAGPLPYHYFGVKKIFGGQNAHFYQLINGQKVVIVPKNGSTVIKTYVNVGSMNEPDNLRGISHYIEHNLFNGTIDSEGKDVLGPGDFFKKASKMGANTNASTGFSQTDYFISSHLLDSEDLSEEIKLHADLVQNPKFDAAQLEKERGPVISEISMVMDDPENIAANTCIKNLFNINSTSTDIVAGKIENIKKITKEDVENYYNTWYTPDNMTTVITGEVDPIRTIGLISQNFNKHKPANLSARKYEQLNPVQTPVRVDIVSPKSAATSVVLGMAGPQNNDAKGKVLMEALHVLLVGHTNARLNKVMEHYQADVDFGMEKISNNPSAPRALLFGAKMSPSQTDKALNELYSQIHKAAYEPPSQKEMEIIKNKLLMGMIETGNNSASLNAEIGGCINDNDYGYLLNVKDYINSITPEDVSGAAKKYFDLNKVSLTVVHPEVSDANQPVSFKGSRKTPKSSGLTTKNDALSFKRALPKTAYDTSKISQYKLPNNMEVVLNPNQSGLTNFLMSFETKNQLSFKPSTDLILNNLLNRGSLRLDKNQFYDMAESNGINPDFFAGPRKLTVTCKLPEKNLALALELSKDSIFNPRFTQEEFDFVKKDVKSKLQNTPKSVYDKLRGELFPDTPYDCSKEKLLANIDSVTLDDVKTLHNSIISDSQAKAVFSADSQSGHIINNSLMSLQVFKPFETSIPDLFKPVSQSKTVLDTEPRNQADIVQSFKFKTNKNIDDQIRFDLLNIIFGGTSNSRLFNDLRESQKLAYRVRSNLNYTDNAGVMNIKILTTTDNPEEGEDKAQNVNKSLEGFKNHIEKITQEPCTAEELEAAKKTLKTKILGAVESLEAQTFDIASSKDSAYGIDATNIALDKIDSVTPKDIQDAACYIFGSKPVTSVLASEKTLKELSLI